MSGELGYKNYRWLTENEILSLKTFGADKVRGYLLEVDLEYPSHLHKDHNDFPLAPESKTITHDMLSPYSQAAYETLYGKNKVFSCKKLVTTLEDKHNYICLGENLDFYVSQGLILKRIHRVLAFDKTTQIAE